MGTQRSGVYTIRGQNLEATFMCLLGLLCAQQTKINSQLCAATIVKYWVVSRHATYRSRSGKSQFLPIRNRSLGSPRWLSHQVHAAWPKILLESDSHQVNVILCSLETNN